MPRLKPELIFKPFQPTAMCNPFPQATRGQHAIDEFSSPMVMLLATVATHDGDFIIPGWRISPMKDIQDLHLDGHDTTDKIEKQIDFNLNRFKF